MNILTVQDVSRRMGPRVLFENISFGLSQGQKVALIARNGTGKSTLLKCIIGWDQPTTGTITFRNDLRIAYLPQEPEFKDGQNVLSALLHSENEVSTAIKKYEEALLSEENPDLLQEAMELMDQHQAWDYESRIREILGKLKLEDLRLPVESLSGGQRKRLALAKVILEEPDLLLLDEPTNHLDLEMIEWLEGFLASSNLSLLMVTHDRYFLERVCNDIIEIDNGKLFRYKGNYSYFLTKKAEREEAEVSSVLRAKNLMSKELEWIRRQPKARGTKSKSRVDAFEGIKEKANSMKIEDDLSIQIKTERMGSKILELHKVSKSYGEKVLLDKFNYVFKRREKIGVAGKNGTGKSTFLNLITGKTEPDTGKIVLGETIKIGYYTQDGIKLKEDKRVIEVITDIAEVIPMHGGKKLTASQLLEQFLFDREKHYQYVSLLSGGEKRRLYLLTILISNPNFLILDEPTNDLDIQTLNVLEEYLQQFEGCALVVSHDRYFMDKIVDHLFVFEGEGKIRDYPGNYTQYRNAVQEEEKQQKKTDQQIKNKIADSPSTSSKKEKTKLGYSEKLEFERLEKEIETLEQQKEEKTKALMAPDLNHEELLKLGEELENIVSAIEAKTERWMELAELAENS